MITPEMLEILRCPMDPKREAKLVVEDDTRLLCGRCRLQFRIREGFPSLLIEEATLPEGCSTIKQLPCQEAGTKPRIPRIHAPPSPLPEAGRGNQSPPSPLRRGGPGG